MRQKSMQITSTEQAKAHGIKSWGSSEWQLISKAWSEDEGWMKSTKALSIAGAGCLVKVSTQQKNSDGSYAVAEALTFVPGISVMALYNDEVSISSRDWSVKPGKIFDRLLIKEESARTELLRNPDGLEDPIEKGDAGWPLSPPIDEPALRMEDLRTDRNIRAEVAAGISQPEYRPDSGEEVPPAAFIDSQTETVTTDETPPDGPKELDAHVEVIKMVDPEAQATITIGEAEPEEGKE